MISRAGRVSARRFAKQRRPLFALAIAITFIDESSSYAAGQVCAQKLQTSFPEIDIATVNIGKLTNEGRADYFNERYNDIAKRIGIYNDESEFILLMTPPILQINRWIIVAYICRGGQDMFVEGRKCRSWTYYIENIPVSDTVIETIMTTIIVGRNVPSIECFGVR